MDATGENVAKLREAYRLWHETLGASAPRWLDLMAEDATMRSVGDGADELAFARGRHGKDEVERYFAAVAEDWEMVHFTPEEFIAQGDRVVVLSRVAFRSRRTGKLAESPKADFFRFRDGRIVEFLEFFDVAKAVAAARPD